MTKETNSELEMRVRYSTINCNGNIIIKVITIKIIEKHTLPSKYYIPIIAISKITTNCIVDNNDNGMLL